MDADDVIVHFGLGPIPVEGAFFHRYWRSPADADEPDGTAIVALLTAAPDGFSQFHRLTIDEIWHFYLGDPAEVVLLHPDGTSRHHRLGHDLAAGDLVFLVIPARSWMAARTTGRWSLFGTTMAPGFTSGCYEGAVPDELIAGWPHERATIDALTRHDGPRRMPDGR